MHVLRPGQDAIPYEHGIDTTYSTPYTVGKQMPATRYYFKLVKFIQMGASIQFEVRVDVPAIPYTKKYWFIEIQVLFI
jgi:hypothetical protein